MAKKKNGEVHRPLTGAALAAHEAKERGDPIPGKPFTKKDGGRRPAAAARARSSSGSGDRARGTANGQSSKRAGAGVLDRLAKIW